MEEYILRWQYGVIQEEIMLHYTYGTREELQKKAEVLAKDERITYITIDKVEEVIKDTRVEAVVKFLSRGDINE